MIDFHTHIGQLYFDKRHKSPLSVHMLIDHMDQNGIDISAVLPLESPEASDASLTTFEVIEACKQYPGKLIPFCCIDPRRKRPDRIIKAYASLGCRGFGEHKPGLWIDDKRSVLIYKACGVMGWPVVMHLDAKINKDEDGLPRLERILQGIPQTIFVMHGPRWWSEISRAGHDERYPTGKVEAGGRCEALLQEYGNLYADLSAGSAYKALMRDPDYTTGFLSRNYEKLLFGTDYLDAGKELPIIDFIRNVEINESKRYGITQGNARRLLL